MKIKRGGVWLLVGGDAIGFVEGSINGYRVNRWLDVCSRYNIEKIIGIGDFIRSEEVYSGETNEIFNQDIVGQIREERHLLDFIEKHRDILDTNTKILRFRLLAETAREAAKKQEGNEKAPYSLEGLLEDMEKENGWIIN